MYPRKKITIPWEGRMEPFRIAGNVYYVGTYQACTHIIDTGEGLIMIDPGYENTVYLIIESLRKLGYTPQDVKYILCTHAHFDHIGGVMPIVSLSGAKTFISAKDAPYIPQFCRKAPHCTFKPDVLLHDGDIVTLGNTSVTCLETPGHTVGTMSFFFDVVDHGVTYRAGSFGGAGRNTLHKDYLAYYPTCRSDYFASIEKLRAQKVDLFLGNHTWNNNTAEKATRITEDYNPFLQENDYYKFLDFCENALKTIIETEG